MGSVPGITEDKGVLWVQRESTVDRLCVTTVPGADRESYTAVQMKMSVLQHSGIGFAVVSLGTLNT